MLESFGTIWRFAGREKKRFAFAIVVSVINAVFSMFKFGSIFYLLQAVIYPEGRWEHFVASAALICIGIAGEMVTQGLAQLSETHAGYFMVANKRVEIAGRLKKVPMGFFNSSSRGQIIGITTTILDDVSTMAPIVLVTMLTGFITTLIMLISFTIYDVRLGLIAIAAAVVYILLMSNMTKRSNKNASLRMESQTELVSTFVEYIKGMSVIKAFNLTGRGGNEDKKMREANNLSRDRNLSLEKAFTPHMTALALCLSLGKFFMLLLVTFLFAGGMISLDKALMLLIASFFILRGIESAGSGLSMLRMTAASIIQAEEIDKAPVMDIDGEDFVPKKDDIVLENVHFSYDTKEVIKGVDLKIPDRSTLAIVGHSGSGKSTIVSLIARFWDVSKGSIKIGGKDIRDYSLDALMRQMSIVFQDVYLFEDTIANNIKMGRQNASFDEVKKAAEAAGCASFIEELSDGYDTVIGEGGGSLSGGEKQRISIARAILKDSPVIILDEATASVDPENEAILEKAFNNLMKDKTVIVIAHRLKTVRGADKIVVMEDGRIAEEGSHDDLMKNGAIYKTLVEQKEAATGWKIEQ